MNLEKSLHKKFFCCIFTSSFKSNLIEMQNHSKFFHFRQNNSGGRLDQDSVLTEHMIIEAESECDALEKAEELGIYFNGVRRKMDCRCCGDRWDDFDTEVKLEKTGFQNIEEYAKGQLDDIVEIGDKNFPKVRIFFLDESVKEFKS
jgi:hypothetical protein